MTTSPSPLSSLTLHSPLTQAEQTRSIEAARKDYEAAPAAWQSLIDQARADGIAQVRAGQAVAIFGGKLLSAEQASRLPRSLGAAITFMATGAEA
jgi:hypothetical protein